MIKSKSLSKEALSVLSRYPNCTSSTPSSTLVEFDPNALNELELLDWFDSTYSSLKVVTEFVLEENNTKHHFFKIIGEIK
jgi:hypothetical protein